MFNFWRFLNGPTLYFDAMDDLGGGGGGGGELEEEAPIGEHPDFETPEGVGGTGEEGVKPGAPAGNGERRAAGEEGEQPVGGRKPGQQPVENVPKHRLDAVIQQRDTLQTEITSTKTELKRLQRLVGASLGIVDPDAPGQPKVLSDREKAIQARILELVPWLKNLQGLSEKAESLAGLAESAPDFERQTKQYWGRVAQQMLDGMEASIAPLILGEGKKATDLSPEMKARYRVDFFNWVQADPKRVDRYEAVDRSLVDDYRKELDDYFVGPVRRQYGAGVVTRQKQVAKLPVGGNSSAPVAGGKPKPKLADEDAAADAAWTNFQERQQARG